MISPKMRMTHHALVRLAERSLLPLEKLEAILNGNFATKVGACRAPGKHDLVHRLFFSPADRAFFVAIQDLADGSVITLLTFEQYKNHYSHVSVGRRTLREVNRMIVEGLAPQDCWQHDNKGERVFVYAAFGVNRSLAHLGQYRAVLAGPALRALGGAPKFWRWIARQCQARNLPIDNIHTVSARLPYGDAEEVQFLCA